MYEFYDLFSVFLRLLQYTIQPSGAALALEKARVTPIDKSRYIC